MKLVTEEEIRQFLFDYLSRRNTGRGLTLEAFGGDFDLLQQGIIDSLGIIEMISEVEKHFGMSIDFEDLPAEEFTLVGPLCRYIAAKVRVVTSG